MSASRNLPAWRSLLFVPATNDRFVDRAHQRGADAVILDLEDSIAQSEKQAARAALPRAAAKIAAHGTPVLVRINGGRQGLEDLDWVVSPDLAAIDVPKVAGRDELERLDAKLCEVEQRRRLGVGDIGLKLIIESAEGVMELEAVARFARDCRRVIAMTLGNEDIATELGVSPSPLNLVPLYQRLVVAARFAGVLPFGYAESVADFQDLGLLRRAIRRARAIGLKGSSCVHPAQIPILNEGFAPSEDELRFAAAVVDAARNAVAERRGVFVVEGRMIDLPLIRRSEAMLARAERLPVGSAVEVVTHDRL